MGNTSIRDGAIRSIFNRGNTQNLSILEKKAENAIEEKYRAEYKKSDYTKVIKHTLEPFVKEYQKPLIDIISRMKAHILQHMDFTNEEDIDVKTLGANQIKKCDIFDSKMYAYEYEDKKFGKVKCEIFSDSSITFIYKFESRRLKFSTLLLKFPSQFPLSLSLSHTIDFIIKCEDACYELEVYTDNVVYVSIDENRYTNHYSSAIDKVSEIDCVRDNLLLVIPHFSSKTRELYESKGFTMTTMEVTEKTHGRIATKLGILPLPDFV